MSEDVDMAVPKIFHTIGYGGRSPSEFIALLKRHNVGLVVDVRLRPDKASMGAFVKSKSADKGIEKLLDAEGVGYLSAIELGNLFLEHGDWKERYMMLLERAGDLILERLLNVSRPFCLMCSEKKVSECHREQIADQLAKRGYKAVHIE